MMKNILTIPILIGAVGGSALAEPLTEQQQASVVFDKLPEHGATTGRLTERQRALAEAVSYAARGNQGGVRHAVQKGLDAGLSVDTLKEAFVQVYPYCGFPRSLNALGTLMSVAKERGLQEARPEPKALIEDALKIGEENQTELCGREIKGELFEFAPAIDVYLKAHLFGDVFSRETLDWKTRELVTIAMLASRENVTAQLHSHINVGKHNGLEDDEVSEILEIAAQTGSQTVLFGKGSENAVYAQYFSGKSYLQPLTKDGVIVANVTFEPRCRNNWHIHHGGGQILLVVDGRGWYQEWGKPAQELKAGDVVNIPAGVKHWHGAAKDSWFTHIAIAVPSENSSTEWQESVNNEEYDKL